MDKDNFIKAELSKNVSLIISAVENLKRSQLICDKLWKTKNKFDFEELNQFEALCSRFARLSDIYTQKLLKPVFILLKEDVTLFLDRVNMGEKIGFITNSEDIKRIRTLRNNIAHDYLMDDYKEIFEKVLILSPILVQEIDKIVDFLIIRQFIDSK